MRGAALTLPGGHLSTSRVEELSDLLGVEVEKRRWIHLKAIGDCYMLMRVQGGAPDLREERDGCGQ